MRKNQTFTERQKEFYQWLSGKVSSSLLSELYMVTSDVDEYGKKHHRLEDTLFELGDTEHVLKLRQMLQGDRRYQFMHYGRSKQMIQLLQKYGAFLAERKPEVAKAAGSKPAPVSAPVVSSAPAATVTPVVTAKQEEQKQPEVQSIPQPQLAQELQELLGAEEYSALRNKLVEQKILTLEQFKTLDLWVFMNRYGLYTIAKRQELYKKIRATLNPPKKTDTDRQYALKTKSGNVFYGETPAEAFAAFCEKLAQRFPLKFRTLIGQQYNGQGSIVLQYTMPREGGVQLSNPKAFISATLGTTAVENYGKWLCKICGEQDVPVSVTAPVKPTVVEPKKPEPVVPSSPEKPKPEVKGESATAVQPLATGEVWLSLQLMMRKLSFKDLRNAGGALWIAGGHELDQFIQACLEKGYHFYYKADGYKAFSQGAAWWTKDIIPQKSQEERVSSSDPKIARLMQFERWLLTEDHLADRTASSYRSAIKVSEEYIEENFLGSSLILGDVEHALKMQKLLMSLRDYAARNKSQNNRYSAALAQYVSFLKALDPSYVASEEENIESSDRSVVYTTENAGRKEPTEQQGSPEMNYQQRQAEAYVLETDLEGMTVEALSVKLHTTVVYTKKIIDQSMDIVSICGKLIHKEAFVDWEDGATQIEAIIEKLLDRNNGYVSAALLYEYVRANMQLFLNDNDLDDSKKIYDLAEHLFEKEGFHGKHYTFWNKTHISRNETAMTSTLDVMRNYAREQGGMFREEDLVAYLESVKIKTGNLRGQMQVYEKPIFLFYDEHVYITAESLKINDEWLATIRKALDRLFADMGDHIVLRDIQTVWYWQLPSLPGDKQWTALLLQSVLRHYSKKLNGAHTIYGLSSQAGDTLHAMIVKADSEIQTFADAIVAVLLDDQIEQREFEAEELRQLLVRRGLIAGNELIWKMPKVTEKDERFIWSNHDQHVTVKV